MSLLDRAVALSLPLIPRPIVGYFSRPYIAGPSADDAFRVIRELSAEGAMATVDILGEFITSPQEARANTEAYRVLISRITDRGLPETNVSVKLSALGLLLDRSLCLDHMRLLMERVRETGNFARIDMEDSPCTTPTLEIYRTLRREYPGQVGIVLQSRLRRTAADLESLCAEPEPTNVRLCKGIYLEPRAIAFTDRVIIQRSYTTLLDRLLERKAYVGIATHDEQLVFEALHLVRRHGLPRDGYEFQMLLGVDAELRRILLSSGHRLRVYVPYGERWYPYSVRRLRENPQIAGHALRALFKRT